MTPRDIVEFHNFYNNLYNSAEIFHKFLEKNNYFSKLVYSTRNGFYMNKEYFEEKYHIPEIEMMEKSSIIFDVIGITYYYWSIKKENLKKDNIDLLKEFNEGNRIEIYGANNYMIDFYDIEIEKTLDNINRSSEDMFQVSIIERFNYNIKNEEIFEKYLKNYGVIFRLNEK
ncbi:MAG: hypothetical protein ACQESN_10455 [Thermotogota bacterium]